MEGTVSTSLHERDMAMSPDGNEIWFTVATPHSTFQTIVFITKDAAGKWSKPTIAPFAGKYSDLEPNFSHDGKGLYFASNRPLSGDGNAKDFDIWVVERNGKSWGTPTNLGAVINTAGNEFYPSITKSGNLYFTAEYENGIGTEDIWVATWSNNQFQKPTVLDSAVNSKTYEFNAFVDPNEKFILFTSYGRKDDTGRGDLYISWKDASSKWKPAVNLKGSNSSNLDFCPYVSPDGKALFFTSERADLPKRFDKPTTYDAIGKAWSKTLNGTGNIYWVSFDKAVDSLDH